METIRAYLPKLRVPSLAQLRDGSFLTRAIQKYEKEHSVIRDFESKLVTVQEVAVWSNPTVSIVWLVLSQILLYYLCNWTSSLVSTFSYLLLSLYVYLTWVYTVWPVVRVPPSQDEDTETWTPMHPDVLSAPELQTFLTNLKSRISQILHGLMLLRKEQQGKFCVVMSLFFTTTAGVSLKFSTPFLLHSAVLLMLVLPGALIRLNRNPCLAPVIAFISEFLSSIVELMVYRGLNAPPRDNSKYLEEFEPEHNEENVSLLNKALGWAEKHDKTDEDLSLLGNLTLPSHEEVENDALNVLLEFEKDLQPPAALTAEQNLATYSDSDSDSDINQVSGQIRDYNDSDSDSLELEPELLRGGVVGTVASSVTGVSTSFTSVLGNIISSSLSSQDRRHSGAEDFEFISQEELELDQEAF